MEWVSVVHCEETPDTRESLDVRGGYVNFPEACAARFAGSVTQLQALLRGASSASAACMDPRWTRLD